MSLLFKDTYLVRGRPSLGLDCDYGSSSRSSSHRSLRRERSLSLTRIEDLPSLSRGRTLLSPTIDHKRSRSLNDIYDRDRDSYVSGRSRRDSLDDYLDREPGWLLPSSKLTRGGVPLYDPSGYGTPARLPLSSSARLTRVRTVTASPALLAAYRELDSTYERASERRSRSYERKRDRSPPLLPERSRLAHYIANDRRPLALPIVHTLETL
jgi:hypothetical protein